MNPVFAYLFGILSGALALVASVIGTDPWKLHNKQIRDAADDGYKRGKAAGKVVVWNYHLRSRRYFRRGTKDTSVCSNEATKVA